MTTFFNAAVNENGRFKSTNQQINNLMGRYFHINILSLRDNSPCGKRRELHFAPLGAEYW